MSNQRSVMTEFRFLDQKRQAEGLTADEAARYAQLRELVGPETAGPPRSGFDVNAAAARLRESLLPAGLRGRPPEPPPPPAAEPPPAEPAPAPEAVALEQAWAEAPFAELAPEPSEPLFDPGSLAQEVRPQAWNPEAPGYDPDAPYDEAAWIAAGYDPNATYDWSAYGYGPDGQPLPAEGAPAEEAQAAVDGDLAVEAEAAVESEVVAAPAEPVEDAFAATEVGFDAPAADPIAPELAPFELAGEPVALEDPLAASPDGQPVEPAAVETAPEAWGAPEETALVESAPPGAAEPDLLALDHLEAEPAPAPVAAAPVAAVADEELPFDPNAPFDHAKWFGRPAVAAAPAPTGPDLAFETAPAAPLAAVPFGEYDETVGALAVPGALDLGAGFEITAEAPAAEPALEAAFEPEPPPAPAQELPEVAADLAPPPEPQADWLGDGLPATHLPAPEGAPFGAYDEAAPPLPGAPAAEDALEAMLPFDPAAASAIEPGDIPEGYDSGGPVLDPATLPPADGAYDDTAAFASDQLLGGPDGEELPGGAPLELGADVPDWQPDAALEQGFELASDGSFGHADLPPGTRTPAWGTAVAAPTDGWESAPALDLAGPFDAPPAAEPVDDLPTIDGAELLEELPPEGPAPVEEATPHPPEAAAFDLTPEAPAAALDVEVGLAAAPEPDLGALDGAFEATADVEAAAYPPPDAEALAWTEPLAEPAPLPEVEPFTAPEPPVEAEIFAVPEPLAEAEPVGGTDPFAAPAAADLAPLEVEPAPAVEPPDLAEAVEIHEPEPAISYEAAPAADLDLPPEIAAAYAASPAGADTFELPPSVADGLFDAAPAPAPEPAPEPEPEAMEAEPLPPPAPSAVIEGTHRVVLHTVDGQVKRGLLVDAVLDAPVLPLQPQGAGTGEEIPTEGIKAIFFMLAPGERAPAPEGKKVRVTFRDGRQVAGFSPDYQEGLAGFFMIPADTRTNTGRIWVYQSAVKAVAIS